MTRSEKALAVLATYYERFAASNKELRDIVRKFDSEFEEVEDMMVTAVEAQRMADVDIGLSESYETY